MTIELGRTFPNNLAVVPPGMARGDYEIWVRFLAAHAKDYTGFWYNIRLGTGRPLPGDVEPALTKDWLYITQKRADAIGIKLATLDFFEVRPQAGPGALGSLLTYKHLWEQQPPDPRPVQWIILTDYSTPDDLAAAAAQKIKLWIA
jgi:hypothetical protein